MLGKTEKKEKKDTFLLKAFIRVSAVLPLLGLFSTAQAQGGGGNTTGGCPPGQICNPLQSTTILEFLEKIIDVLLIFALPLIVFFIIFAGFKFVTARGNESEITVAKTALTWAVVGGVIILGAKLIITVIQGTISVL